MRPFLFDVSKRSINVLSQPHGTGSGFKFETTRTVANGAPQSVALHARGTYRKIGRAAATACFDIDIGTHRSGKRDGNAPGRDHAHRRDIQSQVRLHAGRCQFRWEGRFLKGATVAQVSALGHPHAYEV